jgi:hypothetical protein
MFFTPSCELSNVQLDFCCRVFQARDELLQICCRKVLPGHDQDRGAGREADRLEVLGRVIFEIGIERRRGAVRAHMAHHDRVAVGPCLRAARDAGGPARADEVIE